MAHNGRQSFAGTIFEGRAVCGRSLLHVGFLLAMTVLSAFSATAQDDEESNPATSYFGAIAYSPSTRAHGWSYDYGSRREAERRALARCGRDAGDCEISVSFHDGCAALAIGFDGYGSGWGGTRKIAEGYALRSCGRYSGGCAVVRWVCTSR